MGKKRAAFLSIFLFLAVNVIALSNTIEGFYGHEDARVYISVAVAIASTILATAAFFIWKKEEYKKK